jgi:glycosyltransferase involved in cell wall biosynthesis
MIRRVKRLLVISNMYPSSNAPYFGVFVERQVRAIESLGIECALAVSDEFAAGSVTAAARKYLKLSWNAVSRASSFHPDAILAHFAFPTGAIALASRFLDRSSVPVALVAHGGDVNPHTKRSLAVEFSTRAVLRKTDLLIAVSRSIALEARLMGVRNDRIVVASMGYDSELFVPGSKEHARAKLGLDPVQHYAVVVGNLIERKGIATVLEAAAGTGDLRWILVGAGDIEGWRQRAAHLGDSVSFVGPAAPHDVLTWLHASDIAVVPSLREPLGVAALEALACGIPVIASNTGGLSEIIDDDQTGLLVEPGNAHQLAQACSRLLADTSLAFRLSDAGLDAVKAHTAQSQAHVIVEALEREIARRT